MKTSIYSQVTSQIIEKLEQGIKPWSCPWVKSAQGGLPVNFQSKSHYNGINVLLLWMSATERGYGSQFWLTYKQAAELGGQVRRGEKGTLCTFFKLKEVQNEAGETDKFPIINPFSVFNLDQIDGIEGETIDLPGGFEPISSAEQFIAATGAQIREQGEAAFYQPSSDTITMPTRNRFTNASDYYATALHELTHWTGHQSRCARIKEGQVSKGDYAFEELVAELGSAFSMSELGIDGEVQHASYIDAWLKVLKTDDRMIFKAASKASKAAQYLRSLQ